MIRKVKHILIAVGMLLMAFLEQHCANAVAPTGGPRDTVPPKIVESEPENRSTNFVGRKIAITFDEYITLENPNQNVLVSPPMSEKPDFKLQNKTVVVRFKENLKPNTTYTINFGSSIKDLHEGNPFKDYVFSFSTGDHIDTLCIAGKVLNAEDKKPVENAYVSLYDADRDNLDSLPLSVMPNYITKTNADGLFLLEGLADKKYLIFALKDVNSNLYFDLPNEEVAFLDTLVAAAARQKKTQVCKLGDDTLAITKNEKATTMVVDKDSTVITTKTDTLHGDSPLNLTLFMFSEIDSSQVLLEKKLIEEGLLRFVFRHPAKEAVIMTPEILPDTFHLVTMQSPDFDTIWWYFTPNIKDSLLVKLKYDTIINDSVRFSLKFKDKNTRHKNKETLEVTNNLLNGIYLLPGKDLVLKFSEPIINYQMRDSALFKYDTIVRYNDLAFERTDTNGFEYKLLNKIEDNVTYQMEVPDSVFYGIRGHTNKSIKAKFHRIEENEYGNIYITVVPPAGMKQVVVQLTNENGKVLKQHTITKEEEVMFDYLMPAKYKLRAILDADGNGKWSTGNYRHRTLPETVVEYKDELELKAGWDIDLADPWEL